MTTDPPRLMTVRDVMAYLQVGRSWVLEHSALLGGRKLGGLWRFVPADIEAYVASTRVPSTTRQPAPPKPPTRVRADLPSLADFAARRRAR